MPSTKTDTFSVPRWPAQWLPVLKSELQTNIVSISSPPSIFEPAFTYFFFSRVWLCFPRLRMNPFLHVIPIHFSRYSSPGASVLNCTTTLLPKPGQPLQLFALVLQIVNLMQGIWSVHFSRWRWNRISLLGRLISCLLWVLRLDLTVHDCD